MQKQGFIDQQVERLCGLTLKQTILVLASASASTGFGIVPLL